MEIREYELITKTKQRILEARAQRGINPEKLFVKHSLHHYALVHHELGGEAALAYLAVIGTHSVASESEREEGFTVRVSFQQATGLQHRQFRRGLATLARAAYIEAKKAPGRKSRIRLTAKGRKGLSFAQVACRAR